MKTSMQRSGGKGSRISCKKKEKVSKNPALNETKEEEEESKTFRHRRSKMLASSRGQRGSRSHCNLRREKFSVPLRLLMNRFPGNLLAGVGRGMGLLWERFPFGELGGEHPSGVGLCLTGHLLLLLFLGNLFVRIFLAIFRR